MSCKILYNRLEQIKRIIVKLFTRFSISTLPINGFDLARKMNILVFPYSKLKRRNYQIFRNHSDDGFTYNDDNNKKYIFYNDLQTIGRINNTIFHEIGHIVLDHLEESELAEKEANFFAKYALSPPILIHELQLFNVKDIRDTFNISYQAADYALSYYQKWLQYGPAFITNYEYALLKLFNIMPKYNKLRFREELIYGW